MSIESVHSGKRLVTTAALEGTIIRMKLFVPFAVVLPRKTFTTSRPLTFERLLLVMRSEMTCNPELGSRNYEFGSACLSS